jgi:NitT/TauT family transport system ATP-binding protein
MGARAMISNALQIRNVSKIFEAAQSRIEAIRGIDLDFPAGSFTTLVGASGCGKSTLLRLIAGLEEVTSGAIFACDREIQGPGPDRGVVFQSYNLFPWLTVAQNIAFSSRLAAVQSRVGRPGERTFAERSRELMRLVGLEPFAHAYPGQLSGGMQQRVAIARALLQKPPILLMDEPFAALDAQTRERMQDLLLHVYEVERMTVVFVTHDVEEAIYLGDRVVVLAPRPGRIDSVHVVNIDAKRTQETKLEPTFLQLIRKIRLRIKETSSFNDAIGNAA